MDSEKRKRAIKMNMNASSGSFDNVVELSTVRTLNESLRLSPDIQIEFPVGFIPDGKRGLPLVNTRSGNFFEDRFDPLLFWYLPALTLVEGQDATFTFAATQRSVSHDGSAFNVASLTLSIKRTVPPDVVAAQAQHPAATFREIAFSGLRVTLTIFFKDDQGNDQMYTHPGTAQFLAGGSVRLSFNNILGPAVITAYENLTRTGDTRITLLGLYDVWRWLPPPPEKIPDIWTQWDRLAPLIQEIPPLPPNVEPDPPRPGTPGPDPRVIDRSAGIVTESPVSPRLSVENGFEAGVSGQVVEPRVIDAQPGFSVQNLTVPQIAAGFQRSSLAGVAASAEFVELDPARRRILDLDPVVIHTLPKEPLPLRFGRYVQETSPLELSLKPGKTFASTAYKLKFTVDDGIGARAILGVEDLRGYNTKQSEFSELRIFGDISAKYPSFSKLYLGALSQTIVAIPARYGVVRGATGCAAVCQALVDSSPGLANSSLFQFAFSLGPVVDPVDLVQLSRDIEAQPNLKDCQLQLPSLLDTKVPQTLFTPFANTCTYAAGATPHTFSLAVVIRDSPVGGLAVANANLFIKQLSASFEPFLIGRFGLKLDDFFTVPIEATVVLNFGFTSGIEDLGFSIDESQQAIVLANRSSLDLLLTRYATYTPAHIKVTALHLSLEKQKTTTLPLPADHTDPGFLVVVDRTLALENPLTKQHLGRYLAFQTVNVQEVQFDLGINASAIDFRHKGIDELKAQISFMALPNVVIPDLKMSVDRLIARTRILIPVEYAISKLEAVITFTAQPVNPQHASFTFTRSNDFIDHGIFVVQDSDIPGTF
jgi:hypothetical protein